MIAGRNLITASGTLTSFTLSMPTTNPDGSTLTDGVGCSAVFNVNVTSLTWVGTFELTPPTSATAGVPMSFAWSAVSSSWWPD